MSQSYVYAMTQLLADGVRPINLFPHPSCLRFLAGIFLKWNKKDSGQRLAGMTATGRVGMVTYF